MNRRKFLQAAVSCACGMPQPHPLRQLLDAIRMVESGGQDIVGDNGKAIGPYQIWKVYWLDAGLPGKYEDVRQEWYAEMTMIAYWKRYCPTALQKCDAETLSRVHNGGPRGAKNPATIKYWKKVQKETEQ